MQSVFQVSFKIREIPISPENCINIRKKRQEKIIFEDCM